MQTPAHQKTLLFITHYITRHGYAPSLIEIAKGVGIRSKGTIHRHVQALAASGVIELIPNRKRGIQLVNTTSAMSLPLVGRIAAGRPIEAIPDQDTFDLAELLLGPDRYVLKVIGDSMVGVGILDGDTVIIRRCDVADDGDIVVALIDNEAATLKRLRYQADGAIALIPENPNLSPLVYAPERVAIQGVVVSQLRFYT